MEFVDPINILALREAGWLNVHYAKETLEWNSRTVFANNERL